MPDVKNTVIWELRDNVSRGTKKLSRELESIGVKGKGATTIMSRLSTATGGLVTPTTLAIGAAAALTGGLFEAAKAAAADEESQNRLRASLKANVPAFDGNTDAIEASIKASQRLGFSDEELRDSLTVLVGATHDVGRAQEIMATAMDLARFKGIDLRTASEALIKTSGGHYRALAALGIKTKDITSTQDALNRVQAVAIGQAEAYADTLTGKTVAAQIKFDEAVEDAGGYALPILSSALDEATTKLDQAGQGWEAITKFIGSFGQASDKAGDAARRQATDMQIRASEIRDAYGLVADSAIEMGDDTVAANARAKSSFRDYVDAAVADAQRLIADVYDPVQRRQEVVTLQKEAADLRQALSSGKLNTTETRQAKDRLTQIERDLLETRTQQAAAGELNHDELVRLGKDLETRVRSSKGKVKGDWQDLLNWFRTHFGNLTANVRITTGFRGHAPGTGPLERASGGPIPPYTSAIVGEHGPELVTMGSQGSWVTPNNALGGTQIIQLVVDKRVLAEIVNDENYRKGQRAAPTALRA